MKNPFNPLDSSFRNSSANESLPLSSVAPVSNSFLMSIKSFFSLQFYKQRIFNLTFSWPAFLALSFVLGILLRMTFVEDMEYKEDEAFNFEQSQLIGNTTPWPWYGIPSGVYLVNPGMSIWVFTVLAKLFRIHTPTGLAHAVQAFALLGMLLVVPFAYRFIKTAQERSVWFWAFALACVNPFLVLYQRKLWPEPFLPFFTMLTLMGWWRRDRFLFAFLWGLIGAFLGQIHMSGFFFAGGLFLWTVLFDPWRLKALLLKTHWKAWFLGSTAGALPLVPWAWYILKHPVAGRISAGWEEMIQLKYWVFWLTNPTGLHLGNPIGLLRGPSTLDQLGDFIRYPLLPGTSQGTYLLAAVHIIALLLVVLIYGGGLKRLLTSAWQATSPNRVTTEHRQLFLFPRRIGNFLLHLFSLGLPAGRRSAWLSQTPPHTGLEYAGAKVMGTPAARANDHLGASPASPTASATKSSLSPSEDTEKTHFVQNSALVAAGILMTITGVVIRRYYMAVTYPLEFILLVRAADPLKAWGNRLLATLWVCQLLISAGFVGYIHTNAGSIWGDYGKAYHLVAPIRPESR